MSGRERGAQPESESERASDYVSILLTSQSNSKSCEDNKPISRGASGRPRGGMNRKRSKQRGPHRIGAEAGLCLFRVLCFLFPCFLVALLLRIVDDCSIDWLRCSHPLPPILFTSARGGVRPFRLVFVVLCIDRDIKRPSYFLHTQASFLLCSVLPSMLHTHQAIPSD